MNIRVKLLFVLLVVVLLTTLSGVAQTNPFGAPLGGGVAVLDNGSYMVGYSPNTKTPLWVAYQLPKPTGYVKYDRPDQDDFAKDLRIASSPSPDDYRNSGYDRGHLAPSMGIFIAHGLAECEETFLMTNMAPQKPELNREIWADLERKISLEYSKNMDGVWVITGPVFSREPRRLKSGVAIPDYFYKIVIDQVDGTAWRTLSFLMPQSPRSNETPEYYLVSIDRIEYLTGLDFFSEMPDEYEAQVEAWTAKKLW